MNSEKAILGSIVGGAVVTLVTGLVNYTPPGLVGAAWYGYPASWLLKLVISPVYNPWRVIPAGFVLDFAAWFLVFFIILGLWSMSSKENPKSKSGRK